MPLAAARHAHRKISTVDRRRFQAFAREARVDEAELIGRALRMAAAIPDEFARLRAQAASAGIKHPAIERMQTAFAQQALRCAARLA